VVCGNLIEAFDHQRAARVLALNDPVQRTETLRLMRRFVASTPVDPEAFRAALIGSFSRALRRPAEDGMLSPAELESVHELDRRFATAKWLAGPGRPAPPYSKGRQVKVRAGIWTFAAQTSSGASVVASVVRDRLDRVVLTAPGMNGQAQAAASALAGLPVSAAADVLSQFGESGTELAEALAAAEGRLP
jgi:hypothetical protein